MVGEGEHDAADRLNALAVLDGGVERAAVGEHGTAQQSLTQRETAPFAHQIRLNRVQFEGVFVRVSRVEAAGSVRDKPWLRSSGARTLPVMRGGDEMDDGDVAEYFTLVCDDPSYAVVLLDCGSREMDVVRAVREVAGLSLWHGRVLARRAPVAVLEGLPQDMADDAVSVLRSSGAQAEARRELEPGPCAAMSP
ncbi:ribosomal protein L7/L12 [Streptomyces wedmorensis]|uniref:Ribosomal protein L7/L12 n=1 Tax=Streptomyces wedmorensis TaxID=43759 RepID=A0ABW6J6W1_STRWE